MLEENKHGIILKVLFLTLLRKNVRQESFIFIRTSSRWKKKNHKLSSETIHFDATQPFLPQ